MKNYYYYLFGLIFFTFNVKSQTQVQIGIYPVGSATQAPLEYESKNQETKLNSLLYSEIFTPKIGVPNAASFKQVNFLNIGEYAGSTSINIPIYQILIGQISIPMELNYYSKGVKVDETASNVGQYWSLNVGGKVKKVIKGINDYIALKIDEKGKEVWNKIVGSDGEDIQPKIIETRDVGYLLAGTSNAKFSGDKNTAIGSNDFWAVTFTNIMLDMNLSPAVQRYWIWQGASCNNSVSRAKPFRWI